MATTVVTCAFRFDRVVVCHVGDSRCYLIRHRHAEALTRDHTVTSEQMRLGLLSAKEAAESETRHLLSRSIGSGMFVTVDTRDHQLLPGDLLLLCSDGLHGAVTALEMVDIVAAHTNLEDAVRRLIDVANQKDGSDNVSVQLIRVRSVERVGMYRGRPYKLA
jgi:serine/threonine protein phosphatase PrpC